MVIEEPVNKQKKNVLKHHSFFGDITSKEDRGMLRLWRFNLGSLFENQLSLELALSNYLGINTELISLIHEFEDLPPLRAGRLPLANGSWIMEKTGLEKGEKLGRLKQWLHRLQIERDLVELEEIHDVLVTISWKFGDHSNWPKATWN